MPDNARSPFDQHRADFVANGAVYLPQLLDSRMMALVEEAFNTGIANPSPSAFPRPGSGPFVYSDYGLTHNWHTPAYQTLVHESPLADVCRAVFDTDEVWYIHDQIFWKQGGSLERTPWHQDSTYMNFGGPDLAGFWIALEDLPRDHALEFVRGTHKGPIHVGITTDDKKDWDYQNHVDMPGRPPMPNIEGNRTKFDIAGWPVKRGDVLMFHPTTIHGGAPDGPSLNRRSLTLRFCGPGVVRVPTVPGQVAAAFGEHGITGSIERLAVGQHVGKAKEAIKVRPR